MTERMMRTVTIDLPVELMEEARAVTGREAAATIREALDLLRRTTYGLACRAVKYYRSHELSSQTVAKKLRISSSYVRGLVMCREKLEPEIVQVWKNRDADLRPAEFAATTYPRLLEYAALPPKEQVKAFTANLRAGGSKPRLRGSRL